jgi:hypothetical protein
VAGTGEFGDIRIEQTSELALTAETFLGGERIAFSSATPDLTVISRSPSLTNRPGELDLGLLSTSSVFADTAILKEVLRCSAAPAGASCEQACNRRAELSALGVNLTGSGPVTGIRRPATDGSSTESLVLAVGATNIALRRIEALRRQCVAACAAPPPPPQQAGSLSVAIVFDVAGTRPSQTVAVVSGTLVQGVGGTGMTSFSTQGPATTVAPGQGRSVSIAQRNLAPGTWNVTGLATGFTGPNSCVNVRVRPGGLSILRINVSGGRGLRCE